MLKLHGLKMRFCLTKLAMSSNLFCLDLVLLYDFLKPSSVVHMHEQVFFGKFQFDKFYFGPVYIRKHGFSWQVEKLTSQLLNRETYEGKLVMVETSCQGKNDKCMEQYMIIKSPSHIHAVFVPFCFFRIYFFTFFSSLILVLCVCICEGVQSEFVYSCPLANNTCQR